MRIYNNPTPIPSPVSTAVRTPVRATTPKRIQAPSFRSLEKVVIEGLYSKPKYEGLVTDLINTLRSNPKVVEFAQKYKNNNLKVVLRAYTEYHDCVTSAIHILFDNPAKKKTLGIFGSTRDNVSIHKFGNGGSIDRSIQDSTEELKTAISDESMLNSHLKGIDEQMTKALNDKAEKIAEKKRKAQEKIDERQRYKESKSNLQKAIDSLKETVNNPKSERK